MLDHTRDPISALLAMLRVLVPGGTIYLRHNLNSAVLENWHGLHQWNLDTGPAVVGFGGPFRLWSKDYCVDVSRFLARRGVAVQTRVDASHQKTAAVVALATRLDTAAAAEDLFAPVRAAAAAAEAPCDEP